MSHIFAAAASHENPARNDSILAHAVIVPANPLPIAPAPAQFPAAINPNHIQILSGVSHSSSRKKRTVENATAPPTVAPRNPHDVLEIFLATQEREHIHSNTTTLTSSLLALSGLPDSDNKRRFEDHVFQALSANIQKLSSCVPPPVPPSVSFEPLACSICLSNFDINMVRGTYANCIFTPCEHAFHPACLAEHRRTQRNRAAPRPVLCPNCNAQLPDDEAAGF